MSPAERTESVTHHLLQLIIANTPESEGKAELLQTIRSMIDKLARDLCDDVVNQHPALNPAPLGKAQPVRASSPPAPAKPVLLPAGYVVRMGRDVCDTHDAQPRPVMIPDDKGDWLSRFDVERALRAHGVPVIEL